MDWITILATVGRLAAMAAKAKPAADVLVAVVEEIRTIITKNPADVTQDDLASLDSRADELEAQILKPLPPEPPAPFTPPTKV